ncbi:MAG: CobW family GTP-binding protein [Anaerovoracaceae bacterium]
MIKVVLATGFLGAGKTTLVQSILESFSDKKTAVIVNEFGDVNIDAKLIQKDGIEMAELSNGSIFCACIKDKFVDSLIAMSEMDIEYMFIEASGLADPASMMAILEGIKVKTNDNYDYAGSICVVDGENFLDLYELLPAIHSQLEYCKAVIVNKCDLIDEPQLEKVLATIAEVNPNVTPIITSYCKVNVRELVDNLMNSDLEEKEARESVNSVASRPACFIVKGVLNEKGQPAVIPFINLEEYIKEVAENSYRVKGFAITDKGNIEISCVGKNINILDWNGELENSEIVAISSTGFKLMSTLTRGIEKHLKGLLKI